MSSVLNALNTFNQEPIELLMNEIISASFFSAVSHLKYELFPDYFRSGLPEYQSVFQVKRECTLDSEPLHHSAPNTLTHTYSHTHSHRAPQYSVLSIYILTCRRMDEHVADFSARNKSLTLSVESVRR